MVMSRVGGSQLPNISQKGDRGHVQGDEAPRRTAEPRFISRNVREVRLEFALQYQCFGFWVVQGTITSLASHVHEKGSGPHGKAAI